MPINYNRINVFIETKKKNWEKRCIDILDNDSIQFLVQFLERWHQCVKNGLINYELNQNEMIEMIDSLQRFVQFEGCILYMHLENWKIHLQRDYIYSKDHSIGHDIIEDAIAIDADLRELQ